MQKYNWGTVEDWSTGTFLYGTTGLRFYNAKYFTDIVTLDVMAEE